MVTEELKPVWDLEAALPGPLPPSLSPIPLHRQDFSPAIRPLGAWAMSPPTKRFS